ncbi:MAG TPA: ABC-type transport auxiliary lipoprotein family protein [Steroidobacteraceae bacterium]|jgi:cholesterol transport system auxiliary component
MKQARLLPLFLSMLLLPGCFSGLNSRAPVQQRYLLQLPARPAAAPSAAPAAAAGPATGTLQVLRPNAAPGLAAEGIAVLRPGDRLDYYSNARWAADAPSAVQDLLIDALRRAGRFTTVESEGGPFASQYLLSLDLTHFEARYGDSGAPTVEVELVASLGRRSDRSLLRTLTAGSSVRAQADRMQAVIAAFGQATDDVLGQISAQLTPPTAP